MPKTQYEKDILYDVLLVFAGRLVFCFFLSGIVLAVTYFFDLMMSDHIGINPIMTPSLMLVVWIGGSLVFGGFAGWLARVEYQNKIEDPS